MEHYQNLPQIPQRTPEWHEKKAKILSSTQIASILHLNSFHSYEDLLQSAPRSYSSKSMKITRRNVHRIDPITWGTVLEPIAIQLMEQSTASPSVALGLKLHDQYPFLGASPDGLQIIKGNPRLIEIKCPKKRQITYRVPLEYWVQVQIAMEVWDIDEALYCEYKFDLTTEEPTTKDLTLTYGQLTRGVYWIYQDSWHYVIKRDHVWFQKILPDIEKFYQLKFGQETLNLKTGVKRSRTTTNTGNKRARRTRQNPVACSHHTGDGQQMLSINKLTNYLRDDPILDWLEYHDLNHDYTKEKSLFLDFYNQKNLNFKLHQIEHFISLAHQSHLSYQIMNQSLTYLLDIYQNNLLLKLQYDCHLINETQKAMNNGVDLILLGQMGREVGDHFLWDTFDLIVKKDAFPTLFQGHRFLESSESNELMNTVSYIPIKIKFTTLNFRSGHFSLREGKHRVDMIKMGTISPGLLLDRRGDLGYISKNNDDSKIIAGLQWLQNMQRTSLNEIWPNMKNHYDSQWVTAKEEIANKKDELTKISYMTVNNRKTLHEHGIFKIQDLSPEDLKGLRYANRIMPFISEELNLPPLELDQEGIEVYLDFESCSSLGTGESIIFLMGILVKRGDEDLEYCPYLVENLDKESESKMLSEGLRFLRKLGQNIPIFHWSSAEPNLLDRAGWELPSNCYWLDLYAHFLKNNASIPGCYTYGLKDVAATLYQMKMIQSRWLHGLDGNTAMTMAWNIAHKCKITGERFNQDARIKKLCDYNYVDCVVMEEIRKLLDPNSESQPIT